MLSRALTSSVAGAALRATRAVPRVAQTTAHRHTATYAIRLPVMAHQPLPYLHDPHQSTPAQSAAAAMASGKLVSDNVVASLLESHLSTRGQNGWVLDGFPRNASQAEMLISRADTRPDVMVELVVGQDDIRERLVHRRVDPVSGRVYNLVTDAPRDAAVLARLERRADDCMDVIERRLRVYEEAMPGVRDAFQRGGVPVVRVVVPRSAGVQEVQRLVRRAVQGRRVVLAGAPGCGKGTQGVLLAEDFGGVHVSTGDLLRDAARAAGDVEGLRVVGEAAARRARVVAQVM